MKKLKSLEPFNPKEIWRYTKTGTNFTSRVLHLGKDYNISVAILQLQLIKLEIQESALARYTSDLHSLWNYSLLRQNKAINKTCCMGDFNMVGANVDFHPVIVGRQLLNKLHFLHFHPYLCLHYFFQSWEHFYVVVGNHADVCPLAFLSLEISFNLLTHCKHYSFAYFLHV